MRQAVAVDFLGKLTEVEQQRAKVASVSTSQHFLKKIRREDLRMLNAVLNRFINNNVQLRQTEKTEALNVWQPIVQNIVEIVKHSDERFARLQILPTGSYYERSKVGKPDEFDLMLVMENLELTDDPYEEEEDDGMSKPPTGFTRVMLDRGDEVIWRQESCVNSRGMLSAPRVKSVFARLVREAIRNLRLDGFVDVTSQGPAVTLKIINNQRRKEYSIDLTLAIKDKSWPEDADEWKRTSRNGWPTQQLVQEIWHDGCHLVAKQPKGGSIPEHEKGFLWRYSFSAAEKKLFLRGGHGEASSCRKLVLRILKALKEELNLHPLKSYHLKTMLLYECEAYPHPASWSSHRLSERFISLLQRLENCLVNSNCPHYFIKDFNLFETFPRQRCSELVGKVWQIKSNPEQVLTNLIGQT